MNATPTVRGMQGSLGETARLILEADCGRDEAVWLLTTAMIEAVLENTGGNVSRAAALLHIHRNTLSRNLEQRGMKRLPTLSTRSTA